MRSELGIAMIGCGRIALTHLEAYKDLQQREGSVRLVATVDPDGNRAEQYAQKYGAEFSYKDYRDALDNPAVEAVVLALPNYLHAPVAVEAAKAGKHILVEKPMANTRKEADQMVAAAETAGVTLMVAQSRRHIRALFMAWERIDEIGKPISAVYLSLMQESGFASWAKKKKTNGHLVYTSLGSHTIDYILWLFQGKKKPVRVYSEGYSNLPEVEGIDEASVVIGFEDGALATTTLSMNNRTPRIERVVVIGTDGSMHMEHAYLPSTASAFGGGVQSKLVLNEQVVWDGVQEAGNFTLQMKEFVSCIREGRPPLSDGRDVRHVMDIIEAADLSAERHEVVWL